MDKCVSCGTTVSVTPCKICIDFSFCPSCREIEEHTGVFTCKSCQKTICNTYQMGDPNDPECWLCLTTRRSQMLSAGIEKIKLQLGDNTEAIQVIEDLTSEINGRITEIQKSIS